MTDNDPLPPGGQVIPPHDCPETSLSLELIGKELEKKLLPSCLKEKEKKI